MSSPSTAPADSVATTVRQLRRVPAPASEPRYDDERTDWSHAPAPSQGALALQLPAPVEHPVPTKPRRRHLEVAPERQLRPAEQDAFFGPQPTPRSALPDPKPWTGRYVQALVEVFAGERPVGQLMRWTTEEVYADVTRRVRILARSASSSPSTRAPASRARVRSVHVCEPSDGIVEASVHVRHGRRSRAVAVRLEGWDGRWRCTALHLG